MTAPNQRDDAWSGMGLGWTITATMIAGMLFWGGVGYLVDRLVWDSRVFTAIGVVLGSVAAMYIVYLRYGRGDRGDS
jgi:F0F1-type ATP synthase assembly protein I